MSLDTRTLPLFLLLAVLAGGYPSVQAHASSASPGSNETPDIAPKATPGEDLTQQIFQRGDLDEATLKSSALDALLGEKLQKVVLSTGVRTQDFVSSVIVHVLQAQPKREPAGADKTPLAMTDQTGSSAQPKDLGIPPFSTHDRESLFSADSVMRRYTQELKKDQEAAQSFLDNEENDFKQESAPQYFVDHVYMHVGLSDKVPATLGREVESVILEAFRPVFGNHLDVSVQSGYSIPVSGFWHRFSDWLGRFQVLALIVFGILAALLAMILSKLIPSWKSKWTQRTGHENLERSEYKVEETPAEIPEPEEETPEPEAEIPPEPESPPAAPELTAQEQPNEQDEARLLRERITQLEANILNFARSHPTLIQRVLRSWASEADGEDVFLKINLTVEMIAVNRLPLGKTEFRAELLTELRRSKRKATSLQPARKVELLEEIFWEFIAIEHLSHETKPKALAFIEAMDDRTVLEAMRKEQPDTQAMILMSLNERRAGKLLSLLPLDQRQEVLKNLLSVGPEAEISSEKALALAEHVENRVRAIAEAKETLGSVRGIESFLPILGSLDFESQYVAAKGFLAAGGQVLSEVCAKYFNVGLLPVARPQFLERIFVDRPSDWLKAALSQFDAEFAARVREILPPLQKRMLEDGGASVSKSAGLEALRSLNTEILERLAKAEFGYADIFDEQALQPPGAPAASDRLAGEGRRAA